MKAFVQGAEAAAAESRSKSGLLSIIETYLSTDHKENRAQGSSLAALGSELARCDCPGSSIGRISQPCRRTCETYLP